MSREQPWGILPVSFSFTTVNTQQFAPARKNRLFSLRLLVLVATNFTLYLYMGFSACVPQVVSFSTLSFLAPEFFSTGVHCCMYK